MRFQPFNGQVGQHWECSSQGLLVSGRCFDVALAGNGVARCRYKLQRMTGRSTKLREIGQHPQSWPKARVAVQVGRHVKASSTSGRKLTQQTGLHGPHPKNIADRRTVARVDPARRSIEREPDIQRPRKGNDPARCLGASGKGASLHAETAHRGFLVRK